MNSEDATSPQDDFRRAMQRVHAEISQKQDQDLAAVRTEYHSLTDEQRRRVKDWLERLATNEELNVVPVYVSAKIQFIIPEGDGARAVLVSVQSLRLAVDAWDHGKDFIPKVLRDI